MKPIVVVGIGTEVGKTVVSALLIEALRAGYWKPVQCGLPSDAAWIQGQLSFKMHCYPSCFVLRAPCSPHLAARKEGARIEAKHLTIPESRSPPGYRRDRRAFGPVE